MKLTVFHGVFLVLVMWADLSRGRVSESEFILRNFSQLPYKENMSAETAVNQGSPPYDYLFLVLQWSNTFCTYVGRGCWPGTGNLLTVHGLWPQKFNVPCTDCTGARPISSILPGQLSGFRQRLRPFWPSLTTRLSDEDFWRNEFLKHGSCFFTSSSSYFASVEWKMTHVFPNLFQRFNRGGIVAGRSYPFNVLLYRIFRVTGLVPRLQCLVGRDVLYQIFFCERNGVMCNCDSLPNMVINYNCPTNRNVILP